MKRFLKTMGLVVLVTIIAIALGACENLMQGNVFENFDGPPEAGAVLSKYVQDDGTVDPSRATAFIRDLEDAADSPRFFRELSDTDRERLNTALESVYGATEGDEPNLETRQKAAILAGEVNLRGTDAGKTANNVIDVITGDGIDTFDDPKALLDQIIPDSAQGDPAKIQAILDNLVAAGSAYEAFGETLDDETDAPTGTNMGAVAQNALVAITVKQISEANGGTGDLAKIIANGENVDNPDYGDDGVFGSEDSALRKIFDKAGLGGLLDDD